MKQQTYSQNQILAINEELIKKTYEGKITWFPTDFTSEPLGHKTQINEIEIFVSSMKDAFFDTNIISIDSEAYPFGKANYNKLMHALEHRHKVKTNLLEEIKAL